ncbi:hypothetical protein CEXT_106901 [Caerostris extrusa]|uniref:Uncharacterized protein n=1 Tax=Caerostris extrusa TaxID=172846 RepID=A0AAV4QMD0_CAEEX|nr:hypothetical protein CEXT_106901 [Caerostris extrusa]
MVFKRNVRNLIFLQASVLINSLDLTSYQPQKQLFRRLSSEWVSSPLENSKCSSVKLGGRKEVSLVHFTQLTRYNCRAGRLQESEKIVEDQRHSFERIFWTSLPKFFYQTIESFLNKSNLPVLSGCMPRLRCLLNLNKKVFRPTDL